MREQTTAFVTATGAPITSVADLIGVLNSPTPPANPEENAAQPDAYLNMSEVLAKLKNTFTSIISRIDALDVDENGA
jgi:hypothetical protein